MLYILVSELFLREIKWPGIVGYSTNANDMTVLVRSCAEISEIDIKIERYEKVTGGKINCGKSGGLR